MILKLSVKIWISSSSIGCVTCLDPSIDAGTKGVRWHLVAPSALSRDRLELCPIV